MEFASLNYHTKLSIEIRIFGVQSCVLICVTCDLTVSCKTEYRANRIKQIVLKAAHVAL